jgi:hypothetical protein
MNHIKSIIMITLCTAGISTVNANMRAPYTMQNRGTEELRTSIRGLIVMKEDLIFDCDAPYRGTLEEVMKQKKYVNVTAQYIIQSEQETSAHFDFISTEAVTTTVLINGKTVKPDKPVLIKEEKHSGFHAIDNSTYSISFSGALIKDANTIRISYSHPMSVFESSYGYFTKSRFSTMFTYYLKPLREWTLDASFVMNILIRFRDDTGWSKNIFGSDYKIHAYGVSEKDKDYSDKEIKTTLNKQISSDTLEVTHAFASDFPERLNISCQY